MLKEMGYAEKFKLVEQWVPQVIEVVKKDLKKEHLKKDRSFCRKYFLGKPVNQLTSLEMSHAYQKEIGEGNVGLGEFIATRWLLKNSDIYGYFESELEKISPDFDELEKLDEELSTQLLKESLRQFGAVRTYLFSVLNSVVFEEALYTFLREEAEKESEEVAKRKEELEEASSLEELKRRHMREMKALEDKYNKKLNGMQKKYLHDMDSMKKEVGKLQKEKESLTS